MWKGSLGVTNLQNYHPTPPTFSSGERFSIFQLVVLLFQENWIYICRIARNTTRLTAPQDFPCVMWVVWECKCISVCVFQLTDHWKPKKSCLTHGSLICNQTSLWYIHLLANPQPMTQLDPVTTVNLNLCSYESCHDTSVSRHNYSALSEGDRGQSMLYFGASSADETGGLFLAIMAIIVSLLFGCVCVCFMCVSWWKWSPRLTCRIFTALHQWL